MAKKLPTQQEVKSMGSVAFAQLIKPKEDGGWGLTEDQANELIKDAGIYATTTVFATNTAPHHKAGEEIFCNQSVADKMVKQGWATFTKEKTKS